MPVLKLLCVDNTLTHDWLAYDLSLANIQLGIDSGCLVDCCMVTIEGAAQYLMLLLHILLVFI